MTFTEDHPTGWWPRIDAPSAHTVLLHVYNDGGVVCALLLVGCSSSGYHGCAGTSCG